MNNFEHLLWEEAKKIRPYLEEDNHEGLSQEPFSSSPEPFKLFIFVPGEGRC